MATFINVAHRNIGENNYPVYTVPAGQKAILIGCNVANTAKNTNPFSLAILTDPFANDTDVHIVKDYRLTPGENFEVMRGNKLVLTAGQVVVARCGIENGGDVILSLLVGVQ